MTTESVVPSKEEEVLINSFSRRIIRDKCGNYPPLKRSLNGSMIFPELRGATTNRGNKLLQKSELVTRENLNSSKAIDEECVFYNGSEHNLLQRKRMKFNSKFGSLIKDDISEDGNDDEDLRKLVDVRKVLLPISSLADISNNSSISRVFESKVLHELALKSILMVEKEQDSVISYSKLLDVFLGDIHGPLYESNLKLEAYDHNLELPEEEDSDMDDKLKINTTISTNTKSESNEDPFFALPKINGSEALLAQIPNFESPQVSEELETARQLAQIALQRNQEFIRNLQKIRGYLVKAIRIKERIHAWSKEYTGIQEDGVTVPNVLRAVKRGLISATTNRSMQEEQELEDDDDEDEEKAN